MVNETGYFFGENNRRLFYQAWKVDRPGGIVIITHGLSENTDRYDRLAHALNKDRWSVYAWDLRGHGRSSGIRGYIKEFRLFERDLIYFTHFVLKREKRLPFVFIGHSLGGLILTRALYHEESIVFSSSGICLIAPALALTMNVPLFKLVMGYCAHFLFPWFAFYDKILSRHLSRDPYFQKVIENDFFRHGRVASEIYLTLLKTPKMMSGEFQPLHSRILMQVGGGDMVVDNVESRKIFNRIKSSTAKKLIVYPASMHQLLEDYGYERVMRDLKLFIRPILA